MGKVWEWIKASYQRKALLYQLLLIVALCLTISLVFIVTVFIHVARTIMEDTVCESERNILMEVHKTGDNLTKSMLSVPNLLYSNMDFVRLSQMDRIEGYQNLNSCALIANQLLYANPYFQSVALYFAESGRMVTTDYGIFRDAGLYFDHEIIEFYQSEGEKIRIVESRSIPGSEHTLTTHTIFVKLYTNPSNTRQCTAVLAINSDYQEAFYSIIKSDSLSQGKQILVFNGEELIFSSSALPAETVGETLKLDRSQAGQFSEIGGRDYFIISCPADGRTYLSMVPAEVLGRSVGRMTMLTVFCSIGIFVLCIAIALLFSRKTVRPIERAVAALHTGEALSSAGGKPGDIAGMIQRLAAHNKQLHEELYQSLPVMREEFLRGITQSAPDPGQSFDEMLGLLQIKLPAEGLYLAMMDLETPFPSDGIAGDMFLNKSVHVLLEESLSGAGCRCASYSYDSRTIVILLDLQKNSPKFLFEIFDGVKLHIEEFLSITVSFIICEETEGLTTIYRSYARCQEMRNYKKLYKKGSMISCRSNPDADSVNLDDYPVECENRLLKAVRNADIAEAAVQLDELLGTISQMRSILFLQNFIGNLIRRLSDLLLSAGKRPEKILGMEKLEHIFLTGRYNDDIKNRLIEMITAVINSMSSSSQGRIEQYFTEIMNYIQEHYAEDLSLADVSEHLSISKNYVNVVIHSCTDITFVQILTKTRIDVACRLLETRRYTISEISEKVGFNSPRYFIQVFKKQKGVTPGQYLG